MKSAEEVAKECVDTFMDIMIDGKDIKRPKLLNRIIAEALTAFAEERVSEAIDDIALGLREHEVTKRIRSAALEEASKVVEGMFEGSAGPLLMTSLIVEKIRALDKKP